MNISLILSLLVAGVCFSFVANIVIEYVEMRFARKRLQEDPSGKPASLSVVDHLKPLFSLITPFLTKIKAAHHREILDRKFQNAAMTNYSHEEFWAFQILSSFIFVGFLYILVFELRFLDLKYSVPWWLIILVMAVGFYFPNIWLNSIISKRRKEILLAFPSFVDNLTLTVEAGLDFIAAVNRIVQKMKPSPLREELSLMLSEIRLGSTRARALRQLSKRINIPEIKTFTSVLIQADRLGTSIGKVLRVQAERIRRERFETAERKGALASQKLLFPLVFFIMPAVFIVVFGPLIVKLITEGLEGLMV